MKNFLKCERGESIITLPYAILIFFIVLFIGIDVYGYASIKWKLRTACSEALTIMKVENGFNNKIEQAFYDCTDKLGMDKSEFKITVTGYPYLNKVQRGKAISIKANAEYVFHCLRPLGQEIKTNIEVELTGLAQEYIRGL